MARPSLPGGPRPQATRLVAVGAVVALIFSAWQLYSEFQVARSDKLVREQTDNLASRLPLRMPAEATSPSAIPRVGANRALALSRYAAQVPDPHARAAMLDNAVASARHAAQARPAWGEAWMIAAYVSSLRDGGASPAALDALSRSYLGARYLRHAAAWRLQMGQAGWRALPPVTRAAIVDEAVFLGRHSSELHRLTLDLMRSGPAYGPFMLEWRALRMSDLAQTRSPG